MFSGEVLTPRGWGKPELGEVIAALSPDYRLIWQPIRRVVKLKQWAYRIQSAFLDYVATPDTRIATWQPQQPARCRSVESMVKAYHKANAFSKRTGGVQAKHLAAATPAQGQVHYPSKLRVGLKGVKRSPSVLDTWMPKLEASSVTIELAMVNPDTFYQMDAATAANLLRFAWDNAVDKHIATARSITLFTSAPDLLQTLFILNGYYAQGFDDHVKVTIGTRKHAAPIRPVLPYGATITMAEYQVYDLDVLHPFVRHNGKVVSL